MNKRPVGLLMDSSDEMCDGQCGRVLGAVRHTVEVDDGICVVCQHCFRQRRMEIILGENQEMIMSGIISSQKHRLPAQRGRRGKGRIRV